MDPRLTPLGRRGVFRAGLFAAAAVAWLAGPPALVERVYAAGIYPVLQAALTGFSNWLPLAIWDLVIVLLVGAVVRWTWCAAREARARRSLRPFGEAIGAIATLAAVAYLWFQFAWGLNYARPPVDQRLSLPAGLPQLEEVAALLTRAVDGANGDHAAAHAAGFPGPRDVPPTLVEALHEVERADGRPRPTTPGRPKPTMLAVYFRMAGVEGLTAPALLETLLNPDLTGPERPFTLAHEWAHLAGYAPEADASFVAWRATQLAGPAARYSGWLFLLSEAAAQVPAETRRTRLAGLEPGPRADLEAIRRRAAAQVEVVQRIGWRVYDGYLRSQGVTEGVRSYSRVVELIVRAGRRSSHDPSRG